MPYLHSVRDLCILFNYKQSSKGLENSQLCFFAFEEQRDKPGKYRPMNLTFLVRKLLEKIFRDRIYSCLKKDEPIRDRQHGLYGGGSVL